MIALRHPNIPDYPNGYPVAVNEAQALLMEGNGWVRVEAAAVDYSKMRKGSLLDAAEALGLWVPDKATVEELRDLLEAEQSERLSVLADTEAGETPPYTEEN
jgi:transglutaminase-like putative cysteine protease